MKTKEFKTPVCEVFKVRQANVIATSNSNTVVGPDMAWDNDDDENLGDGAPACISDPSLQ